MSRSLRIFLPGYWYHVYTRGQRQQPLFFSHQDRIMYLSLLDDELNRQNAAIGSFCLMTNHVHMLIKQGEVTLNKIFQKVHTKYARYFNKLRNTKGHVFQGRPGCKIVLNESYLYQLVGYIHRNPVKSGLVKELKSYNWSSWFWFLENKCDWIKMKSWTYPPGFENVKRKKVFLDVVKKEKDIEQGRMYIGNENEWNILQENNLKKEEEIYTDKTSMKKIAETIIKDTCFSLKNLKSKSRNRQLSRLRQKAMVSMYDKGYSLTEIGNFFNRTPAVVSRAYEKLKK